MSDWNATPGVNPATKEANISVAVMYTGGRADKILSPLKQTKYDIYVDPDNWRDHDLIFLDMPGAKMIKQIVLADQPVVYRIRGNLWRAANYWLAGLPKSVLSTNILFPRLDGAVPADEWLTVEFQNRTGNNSTASIGLPIDASEWPTTTHTDDTLRLATLTNADYHGKVDPIKNYLEPINQYLQAHGGEWLIGGDGRFKIELKTATEPLTHVRYPGFIDAQDALSWANVLFHPTQFDIQVPNAVLEGMASKLPVVGNDFPKFQQHDRILTPGENGIKSLLNTLTRTSVRRYEGETNLNYVKNKHHPTTLARQYERYFDRLLNDEQ